MAGWVLILLLAAPSLQFSLVFKDANSRDLLTADTSGEDGPGLITGTNLVAGSDGSNASYWRRREALYDQDRSTSLGE